MNIADNKKTKRTTFPNNKRRKRKSQQNKLDNTSFPSRYKFCTTCVLHQQTIIRINMSSRQMETNDCNQPTPQSHSPDSHFRKQTNKRNDKVDATRNNRISVRHCTTIQITTKSENHIQMEASSCILSVIQKDSLNKEQHTNPQIIEPQ